MKAEQRLRELAAEKTRLYSTGKQKKDAALLRACADFFENFEQSHEGECIWNEQELIRDYKRVQEVADE